MPQNHMYTKKVLVFIILVFISCIAGLVLLALIFTQNRNNTGVNCLLTDTSRFSIDSLEAASTTNIDLSKAVYLIDGHVMKTGEKVLLKNQTNTEENGVYIKELEILVRKAEWDHLPLKFFHIGNGRNHSNKLYVMKNLNNTQKIDVIATQLYEDHIEVNTGTIPMVNEQGKHYPIDFYLYNLKDVNLTSVNKDNVLLHNGTEWVNSTQTAGPGINIDIDCGTENITQISINDYFIINEPKTSTKMFIINYSQDKEFYVNLPKITDNNKNSLYYFLKTSSTGKAVLTPASGDSTIGGIPLVLSSSNDYTSIRAKSGLLSTTWIFE